MTAQSADAISGRFPRFIALNASCFFRDNGGRNAVAKAAERRGDSRPPRQGEGQADTEKPRSEAFALPATLA